MKITSARFHRSAADVGSCPQTNLPEVALIGRSNVGKSSLINLLTERRELAKVSGTPGKTQLINFFTINERWSLVDLPGYGYAKVSQERRHLFSHGVAAYLEQRENLRCVLVLIDSRLEPQDIDLDFLRWLDRCEVPRVLVFTKVDKLSASQVERNIARFTARLAETPGNAPEVLRCSAHSKVGRSELLARIAQAVG